MVLQTQVTFQESPYNAYTLQLHTQVTLSKSRSEFIAILNAYDLFSKPGFHLVVAVAGVFICVKLCEILLRPEIPERPSDFYLVAGVAGVAEEDLLFPGNFHSGFLLLPASMEVFFFKLCHVGLWSINDESHSKF